MSLILVILVMSELYRDTAFEEIL